MSTSQSKQKIPIEALIPGMHVVGLDIPWIDSPFLRHSRTIKDTKDIQALRKAGVKELVIDTDKGLAHKPKSVQKKPAKQSEPPSTQSPPKQSAQKVAPPPVSKHVNLSDELAAAQSIRGKVKKAVENLHDALGKRLPVSDEELSPLIDQTLGSLERNNQALMSLVHLGKTAQKLADHTFSVFCLALSIGKSMGLSSAELEKLGLAALLHEAGWSQLPMNLMGKRTPYTDVELKLIQKHAEVGVSLLKGMSFNEEVLRIVSEHHELGDGSGYPAKLTLEQMHPLSKILVLADHYDERINQLNDRPGMLPTNALRTLYVEAEKGKFDSKVLASFIDGLGIYPVSSAVKLSSGEKAVVLEVRREQHLLPVVEIHYDAEGKVLVSPIKEDLSVAPEAERKKIESVLDPNNQSDDPARRLYLEI